MVFQFLHHFLIDPPLHTLSTDRRWRHHVAGKLKRIKRRILMAFVIAIVTTVITASFAEAIVQWAAPVGFPHPCEVTPGVVHPIKVNVVFIDIINHICIVVK
jgi:hypothetical protein